MKKSELKAKFGRYSAEEKWQHYFACKKKIKKLKQQLIEKNKAIILLEEQDGAYHNQLAISELAEVERLLYESHYKEIEGKYYAEMQDIKNLIDYRIKCLGGESDGTNR